MSRNLILWVIDEQHRAEQQVSEASVKRWMPNVETICMVVKRTPELPHWYENYIIALRQSLSISAKEGVKGVYYDKFLFLDSDTYLTDSVYEIFALLDKYDLVSTHAPARQTAPSPLYSTVPDGYPELNTGVLGYANTSQIHQLFQWWLEEYERGWHSFEDNDQVPLREAMWKQGTHAWIMPPEYNMRFHVGGFASGKVKILHARSRDIAKVAEEINRNTAMRVWEQGTYQ